MSCSSRCPRNTPHVRISRGERRINRWRRVRMAYATRKKLWKLSLAMVAVGLMAMTFFAGRASAVPQPNMEAAPGHLEQAKGALERAEHNNGGFRAKALRHVTQAIAAVRAGLASGNKE